MPNNKPISMRGLWKPTEQEAERMLEYTRSRKPLRFKTLYVQGRQPIVSFQLCGREPVNWIEAGETYFVNIKGGLLADGKTVRRVIKVYPWDMALPKDLPELSLEYLLRPITVLEAWRAARRPVALVRRYTGSGTQDTIRKVKSSGGSYEVYLQSPDDASWMGDMVWPWEDMQSRLDELDEETRQAVTRPDWELVSPLREEHR